MTRLIDLTGQRFGRLIVISRAPSLIGRTEGRWNCLCDCGNSLITHQSRLRNGRCTSCGCYRQEVSREAGKHKVIDLTGKVFGKLTVIARHGNIRRDAGWLCRCECGGSKAVSTSCLRSGGTKSCGCLPKGPPRTKPLPSPKTPPPPTPRQIAKSLGLKRFSTDEPCKLGHVTERDTASGRCVQCIKEEHAAYYRKLHPKLLSPRAQARLAGETHYRNPTPCARGHYALRKVSDAKCMECVRLWQRGEHHKQYLQEYRKTSTYREYRIRYSKTDKARENNRKQKATPKAYDTARKWRANSPKYKEAQRRYREKASRQEYLKRYNKLYSKTLAYKRSKMQYNKSEQGRLASRADHHRRKARILANGGSFTKEQIQDLLIKQRKRCANPACSRPRKSIAKDYHIEHKMPIALGGSNDISNIQLYCPTCNLKKHAKDPIVWAQENGFLL